MALKNWAILFLMVVISVRPTLAADLPFTAPSCVSYEKCDRNPADFERFLRDFYAWHADTNRYDGEWDREPGKSIFKAALTHSFYKNLPRLLKETDDNPIEHGLDYTGQLVREKMSMKALYVYGEDASVDLVFGTNPSIAAFYRIGFKAENGQWKIDSVIRTDLPYGR